MHLLHLLTALDPAASTAVDHLLEDQRHAGDLVTVVHAVPGDGVDYGGPPPDVVHGHGSAAAAPALALADRLRCPLVLTVHDWMREDGARAARPMVDAIAKAHRIIAPSRTAAALLAAAGLAPTRVRIIPYAVPDTPDPCERDGALVREIVDWRNRGGEALCAIGDRPSGAHHEVVLQAVAMSSRREALLCILAGVVSGERCARLARELGVEAQVRLCGADTNPRTMAARCDYVALPGFDERRPFGLAEAWCDGVPVLAGRNPQFAEMDTQGAGTIFFDAGDAMDLARALATVRHTTTAGRRLLVDRARVQYRLRFTAEAAYGAHVSEYDALRAARRSVA